MSCQLSTCGFVLVIVWPLCWLQVEVYRGLLRTKRITSLLYGVGSGDSEGVLPAITGAFGVVDRRCLLCPMTAQPRLCMCSACIPMSHVCCVCEGAHASCSCPAPGPNPASAQF